MIPLMVVDAATGLQAVNQGESAFPTGRPPISGSASIMWPICLVENNLLVGKLLQLHTHQWGPPAQALLTRAVRPA